MSSAIRNITNQRSTLRQNSENIKTSTITQNANLDAQRNQAIGSIAVNALKTGIDAYSNIASTLAQQENENWYHDEFEGEYNLFKQDINSRIEQSTIGKDEAQEEIKNYISDAFNKRREGKKGVIWNMVTNKFQETVTNNALHEFNTQLPQLMENAKVVSANNSKNAMFSAVENGDFESIQKDQFRNSDIGGIYDYSLNPNLFDNATDIDHYKLSEDMKSKDINGITDTVNYLKDNKDVYDQLVKEIEEEGKEVTDENIVKKFEIKASEEEYRATYYKLEDNCFDLNYSASHGNLEYATEQTKVDMQNLGSMMNVRLAMDGISAEINHGVSPEKVSASSIKPSDIDPVSGKRYSEAYSSGQIWYMNQQIESAKTALIQAEQNKENYTFINSIDDISSSLDDVIKTSGAGSLSENALKETLEKMGIRYDYLDDGYKSWIDARDAEINERRSMWFTEKGLEKAIDTLQKSFDNESMVANGKVVNATRRIEKYFEEMGKNPIVNNASLETLSKMLGNSAKFFTLSTGESLSTLPELESTNEEGGYKIQWSRANNYYLTDSNSYYTSKDYKNAITINDALEKARVKQEDQQNVINTYNKVVKAMNVGFELNINANTSIFPVNQDGQYQSRLVFGKEGVTVDILTQAISDTGFYRKNADGTYFTEKDGKYTFTTEDFKTETYTKEELPLVLDTIVSYKANEEVQRRINDAIEKGNGNSISTNIAEEVLTEFRSAVELSAKSKVFEKYDNDVKSLKAEASKYSSELKELGISVSDIDATKMVGDANYQTYSNLQKGTGRAVTSVDWDGETSRLNHYLKLLLERNEDGSKKYTRSMVFSLIENDKLLSQKDYDSLSKALKEDSELSKLFGGLDQFTQAVFDASNDLSKQIFGTNATQAQKDVVFQYFFDAVVANAQTSVGDPANVLSQMKEQVINQLGRATENITNGVNIKDMKNLSSFTDLVDAMYDDYLTNADNGFNIIGLEQVFEERLAELMVNNSGSLSMFFVPETTKDWSSSEKYAMALNVAFALLGGGGNEIQFDHENLDDKKLLADIKDVLTNSKSSNLVLTLAGMVNERKNKRDTTAKLGGYYDAVTNTAQIDGYNVGFEEKNHTYVGDAYILNNKGESTGVKINQVNEEARAKACSAMQSEILGYLNSLGYEKIEQYYSLQGLVNIDYLSNNSKSWATLAGYFKTLTESTDNKTYYVPTVKISREEARTRKENGDIEFGYTYWVDVHMVEADANTNPVVVPTIQKKNNYGFKLENNRYDEIEFDGKKMRMPVFGHN